MPIYKRCSRCGKRIESSSKCSCLKERHREYDRYSRDRRSKQYYSSREWEIARDNALTADGGIDVYMYMTEGIVLLADTVHHIVPLKDDWNKRSVISNLMSLNHDTHSMIEQMYKKDIVRTQSLLMKMLHDYRSM